MESDWKQNLYSLDYLEMAAHYALEVCGPKIKAMDLLEIAEIIPHGTRWRRGNSLTRTNLDGNAIRADYLAELAYEWDKDGLTSPVDFVKSIEFEVNGHPKNDEVSAVLSELGR